jgi:hypothetical protein
MRVRGVATFAAVAAAALAAGCGEDDFENEPRAPVTMELSGVISDDGVTISPSRNIGAGPFAITIANLTETAETQRTLAPGTYEVSAGTAKAVKKPIEPASLDIGPERPSSNNDLLLP